MEDLEDTVEDWDWGVGWVGAWGGWQVMGDWGWV